MSRSSKKKPFVAPKLLKRIEAFDRANRRYFIDYKVKQPFTVDLSYTIGLVTNKYELINKFNQLVNEKFKAINCYLRPNGHYIPMKLNDILKLDGDIKLIAFEEGFEFDALVLDDSILEHPQELTLHERLERAVYLSLDEKRIIAKFVAGREINI